MRLRVQSTSSVRRYFSLLLLPFPSQLWNVLRWDDTICGLEERGLLDSSSTPTKMSLSLAYRASLGLSVVRLEADLQHPVAERVPVERLDRHETLVVVSHGDEAESLALVRLQVSDDLHIL